MTHHRSLLTDLYQITMAYGYWRQGMHERDSVFHLFYRSPPFGGRYVVAAGLETALKWLEGFALSDSDLEYLRSLVGNDSQPLFCSAFLADLAKLRLTIDLDAMREGTIVYPHEPLLRVRGPLWQCQWIETALLNTINFQSLIATKASRIRDVAGKDIVLEFGLRRAQGVDGAMSASRAAYLGGCDATSNVLAGREYGIPVRGTHAHSWVMSFDSELESFNAYADAMPNNCIFLVDTYDTLQGVKHAIEVGQRLRDKGHAMAGIRLDSGDLTALSRSARAILDEAGFHDAKIVASSDLDENAMREMKAAGSPIAVWGIGTKLATAYDQPALGGVYKLAALEDDAGNLVPRIKLSETAIKTSVPGMLQVRRYYRGSYAVGDILYSELTGAPQSPRAFAPTSNREPHDLSDHDASEDLLVPVMRGGRRVASLPTLSESREFARMERQRMCPSTLQLENPSPYRFGLEERLSQLRSEMIAKAASNKTKGAN
jgi:nicotinate phosphoribosyltransferase